MVDYYTGKVCIVTGANSGIGYAISEELLKRGATVYMAGRSREKGPMVQALPTSASSSTE